jgi:hypothetical protein
MADPRKQDRNTVREFFDLLDRTGGLEPKYPAGSPVTELCHVCRGCSAAEAKCGVWPPAGTYPGTYPAVGLRPPAHAAAHPGRPATT